MKKPVLILFLLLGQGAYACTTCNKELQKALFNSTFYPNLFTMLLAFIVLAIIIALLVFFTTRREKKYHLKYGKKITVVPLLSASVILGIGIGGVLDGTILHQILQWHEMLSNKIPPTTLNNKSVNMFWDGVFHLYCLVVIIIGLFMLFKLFFRKDVIVSWKIFIGGLLLGWGIFNIVEGIIDHHILKLHNVREFSPDVEFWNVTFLGMSIIVLIIGSLLVRKGATEIFIGALVINVILFTKQAYMRTIFTHPDTWFKTFKIESKPIDATHKQIGNGLFIY